MEIDSQKPASVKRRDRAYLLKSLPSVDHLVKLVPDVDLPFEVKVRLARELLSQVRETLVGEGGGVDRGPLSHESLAHRLRESSHIGGFRRVVNATGIVLHTNLGRAPFGKEMLLNLAEVASDYLDLEFAEGTRGSRTRNSERGLCLLTGAEGAVVVNNNASALLLVLSTLSCDKEVIVSRGELVQIGGGFRIPDILASSQARLVEVGTTNITSSADYDRACGERTALILSVNRSNFTITGHTESPSLADLKLVADRHALTLCYDQGSGDISHIERSLKKSDLVTFSGDKLLGGPQAGIVVGRRDLIERLKKSPLYRALRLGKLDLFCLEWILARKLSGDRTETDRILEITPEELRVRAGILKERVGSVGVSVVEGSCPVGGGSRPGVELKSFLLVLAGDEEELSRRLLSEYPAIVARKDRGKVLLDLRTVRAEDEAHLVEALKRCLS